MIPKYISMDLLPLVDRTMHDAHKTKKKRVMYSRTVKKLPTKGLTNPEINPLYQ